MKVVPTALAIGILAATAAAFLLYGSHSAKREDDGPDGSVQLPPPDLGGKMTVETALSARRSVRSYRDGPIGMEDLSRLLWAAQGITHPAGLRTAPSAGALYPLEVFLVAGKIEGIEAGVYRYNPDNHTLTLLRGGDGRARLARAALDQSCISSAPLSIVICAIYGRVTGKYGDRGIRYAHMEAGHVSQNIYLLAESRGLGTVNIGAFQDDRVRIALGLTGDETPLCIMPVGKK